MSTPIGTKGRLPTGESWQRAMDLVAKRLAEGAKRRYRIRGRRIEQDWWAYDVSHAAKEPPPVKEPQPPMSRARIAEMSVSLPRCAQRARAAHGGGSKVAWPSQAMAWKVAAFLGKHAYQCELPAPAIGQHWHVSTSKRKRKG